MKKLFLAVIAITFMLPAAAASGGDAVILKDSKYRKHWKEAADGGQRLKDGSLIVGGANVLTMVPEAHDFANATARDSYFDGTPDAAVDDLCHLQDTGMIQKCTVAGSPGTWVNVTALTKGPTGATGAKGDTGDTGAQGEQGVQGEAGSAGADGTDAFVYVAYASDNSGTDWSLTPTGSLKYRAEIHETEEIASPQASDFSGATWVKYIGDDGADGAGSQDATEVDLTATYDSATNDAPENGDSVEDAIGFLHANIADILTALGISQGDTALGTLSVVGISTTADEGDRYFEADNGTETLSTDNDDVAGRLAWSDTDSLWHLSDGTDWADYLLTNNAFTGNTETGITITPQSDGTVDAVVSISTGEIAAATLVTEAEGIASNDNDTTVPTSAAVNDLVAGLGGGHDAVSLAASATTGGLSLSTQEIGFRAATNAQTGYATATHITAIEANTSHAGSTSNPHSVDATDVGLGNVDNTSDATKNAASVTLTNKTITTPVLTLEQSTNPTNTTEGRAQWDTDDDMLIAGDGAAARVVATAKHTTTPLVIYQPDDLASSTEPDGGLFPVYTFDAETFPAGVTLTSIVVETSATCTDSAVFEERTNNGTAWSANDPVDTFTLSGTSTTETTITDSAIAADATVFVNLPASPTDIDWWKIHFTYTINTND